ncbi:MAG: rRNA pseudouridine synthase [Ahniella sp.]|nr:rRNA pseudouridine synthase [Ahniella sp.]
MIRPPPSAHRKSPDQAPRHGLARVLSKRGIASRTEAARWVRDGRVAVNGKVIRDPEFPVHMERDHITVDNHSAEAVERIHVMLNKPRGLVTTVTDERGRDTVYRCLDGSGLPWLAPVGRLDQASEGLLLFCNDPAWAAAITEGRPNQVITKTYHVQIDRVPDADLLRSLETGVIESGESLSASSATLLRAGQKNAWLEIVLDEGRNRQIRRLLKAHNIGVLRLIRIAIGTLKLGDLPKGQWRHLSQIEVSELVPA